MALLGTGGMADVYSAEHLGSRGRWEHVAVKRMHVPYREDQARALLFDREARAAATLSHDNIVQIFDSGRDDRDRPFLVMELVRGVALDELMECGPPLPFPLALYIIDRVARALEHAHAHGILHRDISPCNVLLSLGGEVKLTDFGLAKIADDSRISGPGWKGKTGYLAPELIADETRAADPRSDLYALGATLYQLLTGHLPFGNPDQLARYWTRAIRPEPPTPPSELHDDLPPHSTRSS